MLLLDVWPAGLKADTSNEINAVFAALVRERSDALFVANSPFFTSRRIQLVQLAARYAAIPATYPARNLVEYGGLMSYGADIADAVRQLGVYTGRILKGEKPADLPVQQPTKYELVSISRPPRRLASTVPPHAARPRRRGD